MTEPAQKVFCFLLVSFSKNQGATRSTLASDGSHSIGNHVLMDEIVEKPASTLPLNNVPVLEAFAEIGTSFGSDPRLNVQWIDEFLHDFETIVCRYLQGNHHRASERYEKDGATIRSMFQNVNCMWFGGEINRVSVENILGFQEVRNETSWDPSFRPFWRFP